MDYDCWAMLYHVLCSIVQGKYCDIKFCDNVEAPDDSLHALQKISDLRASLGDGMDQGIVSPPFEGGVYVSALALLSQSQTSRIHLPSLESVSASQKDALLARSGYV